MPFCSLSTISLDFRYASLEIYLIGLFVGAIFIITAFLADNSHTGFVIVIGLVTVASSLIGVGVHESN